MARQHSPRPPWPAALLAAVCISGLAPSVAPAQFSTADHLSQPGWWPTKGTPARSEYVGRAVCAECHAPEAAAQPETAMGSTFAPAADSRVLATHPAMSFHWGPYDYELKSHAGAATLSVADGKQSVSAPLTWAFGSTSVGQSYLFERDGAFFESRVSFFPALGGLNFTPGRALEAPTAKLEDALARPVDPAEARQCFGCHTTASTTANHFDAAGAIPGVSCEACHGPGAKHVAAMRSGKPAAKDLIFNPAKLDPEASVDFCGACHGASGDVSSVSPMAAISSLRFQPFQLETSRCWGEQGDARLVCTACHNPHEPLVKDASAYDRRCLSCHLLKGAPASPPGSTAAADHPGKACPVAARNCVTCHMPQFQLPGMHSQFTDHLIRVVRASAPGH